MFELTSRTHVGAGAELSEQNQRNLLKHIIWFCRGNLPTYRFSSYTDGYDFDRDFGRKFPIPLEMVSREGKLGKRVSKYIKLTYNYEMDGRELSELGALISSFQAGDFDYDIVDEFDWEAGDFGDAGSCFWQGRSKAKEYIKDGGGRAIRFFDDEGNGNGRAWVMPKDGGDWVVFNAYGPDLEMVERRVALLYPQAKVRRVGLKNWGDGCGTLWINNESGILVSPVARQVASIDLQAGPDANARKQCYACEQYDDEEDGHYYNHDFYCESCYDNRFTSCECCQETVLSGDTSDEMVRWRRAGVWFSDWKTLCEDCRSGRYFYCDDCGFYLANSIYHPHEVANGNQVCKYCLDREYHHCDECDCYMRNGEECECNNEEAGEEEDGMKVELSIYPLLVLPLVVNHLDYWTVAPEVREWYRWDNVVASWKAVELEQVAA